MRSLKNPPPSGVGSINSFFSSTRIDMDNQRNVFVLGISRQYLLLGTGVRSEVTAILQNSAEPYLSIGPAVETQD